MVPYLLELSAAEHCMAQQRPRLLDPSATQFLERPYIRSDCRGVNQPPSRRNTMGVNKHSASSLDKDVPDKPLVFVVEGRYQNWIKPVILLECLGTQYETVCLDGPATRTDWYTKIHPQRYVPALIDSYDGRRITSWDSSQILEYLAARYDNGSSWGGRDLAEHLEIGNWLTFETASLGYQTFVQVSNLIH
jgi:hypothetical protein